MDVNTLSPDQIEEISPLTAELDDLRQRSISSLSRTLVFNGTNLVADREGLIEEAVAAQNIRRNALRVYLENRIWKDLYKKIYENMMAENEDLQTVAENVIFNTMDDLTTLLWLLGESFGHIRSDNYEADKKFMLAQIERIRDLIPLVLDTYLKGKNIRNKKLFESRTEAALQALSSRIPGDDDGTMNYQEIADQVNGIVWSTNVEMSHVRY